MKITKKQRIVLWCGSALFLVVTGVLYYHFGWHDKGSSFELTPEEVAVSKKLGLSVEPRWIWDGEIDMYFDMPAFYVAWAAIAVATLLAFFACGETKKEETS